VVGDHTTAAGPGAKSGSGALWWTSATIVVAGALVLGTVGLLSLFAPGAMLALVGHAGEQPSPGTRVFADYTGTRDVAIAVVLLVLLAMRSSRALPAVLLLTALANGLDAAAALASQRWPQLPGALGLAIAFLVAAILLSRRSAIDPSRWSPGDEGRKGPVVE
jgi:Domain of unknown function (DUF4267)